MAVLKFIKYILFLFCKLHVCNCFKRMRVINKIMKIKSMLWGNSVLIQCLLKKGGDASQYGNHSPGACFTY